MYYVADLPFGFYQCAHEIHRVALAASIPVVAYFVVQMPASAIDLGSGVVRNNVYANLIRAYWILWPMLLNEATKLEVYVLWGSEEAKASDLRVIAQRIFDFLGLHNSTTPLAVKLVSWMLSALMLAFLL